MAYYFVEKTEFERGIENNAFLEYAQVHEHYYGTSRMAVERVLDAGACCILDIDVQVGAQAAYKETELYKQGARQIRKSGIRAVFVFIAPPSMEELEKRLRGRGTDGEEQVFLRLKAARTEMQRQRSLPGLLPHCVLQYE